MKRNYTLYEVKETTTSNVEFREVELGETELGDKEITKHLNCKYGINLKFERNIGKCRKYTTEISERQEKYMILMVR